MNSLLQAVRSLSRSPRSVTVAALSLGFGIGGPTAIFSIVNAVLLRPLPFNEPGQLAVLWKEIPRRNIHEIAIDYSSLKALRGQSRLTTDMALFEPAYEALSWTEGLERIKTTDVSGSFFSVLGVSPALGTLFTADDDHQRTNLAVLSYRFWASRFGRDQGAIGRSLEMTGKQYRIVAVMPERFWFPDKEVQLWTLTPANGIQFSGPLLARLKRGICTAEAQAEIGALAEHIDIRTDSQIRLVPLLEQLAGKNTKRPLNIFLAATVVLLLIACSNAAHLLMARAVKREREFAIRAALGASRKDLLWAMVSESVVLALIAGALGLAAAYVGTRVLPMLAPSGLLRLDEADLSVKVASFTLAATFGSWLLFGLAPVLKNCLSGPATMVNPRGSSSASRGHASAMGLVVVSQFAMAALLLTGSGLLLRSFLAIEKEDPGMQTNRLLSMRIYSMRLKRLDPRAPEFYRSVFSRINALPGVEAAGVISAFIKEEAAGTTRLIIEGVDNPRPDEVPQLTSDTVSAGFFRAVGVPLLAGREFGAEDTAESPPVALVNQALAARFGTGNSIGRRFQIGSSRGVRPWLTVVGVVGNIRQLGLERFPMPEVYVPLAQNPLSRVDLIVRTARGDPMQLAPGVTAAIHEIDKSVVAYDLGTMESRYSSLIEQRRFQTSLLVALSAIALTLAAWGIYAAMHYLSVQRTRDIGIRMALGARREDIFGMVLGAGLRLACIGVILGLMGAQASRSVLSSFLYGVAPSDPLTLGGVSLVLVALAVLAVYLPARRATSVDPVTALRAE